MDAEMTEGRYVQFHNPSRYLAALPGRHFNGFPDYGIVDIF